MDLDIVKLTSLYADDTFKVGNIDVPIISAMKKKLSISDMSDPSIIGLNIHIDKIVSFLHVVSLMEKDKKLVVDKEYLSTIIYLAYYGYIDKSVFNYMYLSCSFTFPLSDVVKLLSYLNPDIYDSEIDYHGLEKRKIKDLLDRNESYYEYRFNILSLANK